MNRPVIEEALKSRMTDFEDAVLACSANLVGVSAIVTRNTKDFKFSPVKAQDPFEFLAVLMKNRKRSERFFRPRQIRLGGNKLTF